MRLILASCFVLLFGCQVPYNASDIFEEKAQLPKDEAPHTKNSLEWWYFTGHLEDTAKNKKLGVEYVVFHFNPTNVKGGWLLNMAVSDPETKEFYYDHKFFMKSKEEFASLPLEMSWDKGGLTSSFSGQEGVYQIEAQMSEHKVSYELSTQAGKGVVLHDGIGYENYGDYATAGYYTYPRLPTQAKVQIADETYEMQGNLWYDRQWNCSGVWERKVAWDWFSIQFEETQSELMLYRLYHIKDSVQFFGGTYTDREGKRTDLEDAQIQIEEVAHWRSLDSDAKYPTEWEIAIPDLNLSTNLKVAFPEQELALPFTPFSKFYYWEGMSYAEGEIDGKQVKGKSYVEMTNRFRIKEK